MHAWQRLHGQGLGFKEREAAVLHGEAAFARHSWGLAGDREFVQRRRSAERPVPRRVRRPGLLVHEVMRFRV